MSTVLQIYEAIDRLAPFFLSMDFDNTGILVGDRQKKVERALLTSEVKQHEYLAAAAAGISIFDAGHFDTEDVVIEPLWEYLTKQFADVEFFTTHHTVIRAV